MIVIVDALEIRINLLCENTSDLYLFDSYTEDDRYKAETTNLICKLNYNLTLSTMTLLGRLLTELYEWERV